MTVSANPVCTVLSLLASEEAAARETRGSSPDDVAHLYALSSRLQQCDVAGAMRILAANKENISPVLYQRIAHWGQQYLKGRT